MSLTVGVLPLCIMHVERQLMLHLGLVRVSDIHTATASVAKPRRQPGLPGILTPWQGYVMLVFGRSPSPIGSTVWQPLR